MLWRGEKRDQFVFKINTTRYFFTPKMQFILTVIYRTCFKTIFKVRSQTLKKKKFNQWIFDTYCLEVHVSKLSFTKWQWKSVLERIHLDFICKNPTYFNQPLDFQGYFWKKKYCPMIHFSKIFYFRRETKNHIFILRSFFKRKTRLYTYGPSIYTNNNIILTLYFILILYLILNHYQVYVKILQ